MGLTVAEAFILLSFCLLLLFSWWQMEADRKRLETERKSLIVAEGIGKLTDQEKAEIVEGLSDGTFEAAQTLRSAGFDLSDTTALEDAAQYSRFMRDEDFQRLMKGVVKLSPETRLSLANAVAVTDEVALRAKLATVEPSDSTIEQIAGRLQKAAKAQGELVSLLDNKLGDVIREAGGSIDAKGTITLPQAILFDPRSDVIKDPNFLRSFCVPWLETLRQSGMSIADLKIEGHASSEWAGEATKEQAYLQNLDLSQRRARNALSICLSEIKDPDTVAWVREHLAAIGYSSARLIYGPDGTEDHDASRRVMFSVGLNQEGLIDDIRRDVTTPDALMDATGQSRVIDGDTLEIQETSYRLSGIDAPELGQQCRSKDGTYFDCGEVARRGLEQAIAGKPVACHASELDMYKRPIATCEVEGQDLAELMIEQGYAVASEQYSQIYVSQGETAQAKNIGIWQTEFQMPWDYRNEH